MDVLIGECINLICIIFSISILNWVVGYRKYSDIDFLKNIVIQATIIIVLYVASRYISIWNIAILDNNISQHSALSFNLIEIIKSMRISKEKAIWIISNIVIMGSGEPMDNYDNIVKFVRLITSSDGLNISQRNITISTCGIVPRMRKLAEEGLQVTLALSLHAPNDEIRRNLMPIAKTYSIEDILSACSYYFEKTGRRVSYEYSLVRGVNDNKEEAKRYERAYKSHTCKSYRRKRL